MKNLNGKKIEMNIIIFLFLNMTVPVVYQDYIVITKTLINNTYQVEKYTGTCYGVFMSKNENKMWLFRDVARIKSPYDVKHSKIFTRCEQYLELRKMNILIKNARLARENMEKRALNMILKRLVNEEFQWY